MSIGGIFLRIFSNGIRVLQFLAAAVILGIFSFYLAELSHHHLPIATWIRAVEGLSGAATLYALFGSLFTICLGGSKFFGFLAMVLDVCMIGAMTAIAVLTRGGTQSCNGTVHTPLGTGPANSNVPGHNTDGFGFGPDHSATSMPDLRLACRLEKTAFAVSIASIVLFVISMALQIPMARHHQREKRIGPSPANGYTSGSGRRGWFRRRNRNIDGNPDLLPSHPSPGQVENGWKSRFH